MDQYAINPLTISSSKVTVVLMGASNTNIIVNFVQNVGTRQGDYRMANTGRFSRAGFP
jgi:hypothetical protein